MYFTIELRTAFPKECHSLHLIRFPFVQLPHSLPLLISRSLNDFNSCSMIVWTVLNGLLSKIIEDILKVNRVMQGERTFRFNRQSEGVFKRIDCLQNVDTKRKRANEMFYKRSSTKKFWRVTLKWPLNTLWMAVNQRLLGWMSELSSVHSWLNSSLPSLSSTDLGEVSIVFVHRLLSLRATLQLIEMRPNILNPVERIIHLWAGNPFGTKWLIQWTGGGISWRPSQDLTIKSN